MRVIAGKAKGRKLRSVPGDIARPITDRVKESLFNILRDEVVDALFLDLFAGTGSVGIEALSRGARRAVDLIYIAPPQYKGLWAKTLLALDGRGFLTEDGLAIAQIFPKEYQDLELSSLSLVDQRKYGSTMLCFYRLLTGGGTR